MKIALLTDGIYPYVVGGMQKHSYYLAKYLAKQNIEVYLFHTNNSQYNIAELECFTEAERKNIHSIVIDFPKFKKIPGHYLRASYQYSKLIFEYLIKNKISVDFIYAKGFAGWYTVGQKVKEYKLPPIGLNFHGYEMFQQAPNFKSRIIQKIFLRKPVKWLTQNANFVFSYGGKITTIIKALNVTSDKIIQIPTGIEPSWINKNFVEVNKSMKFIFVGRYERRKGIEELNFVLKKIIGENNFTFEFVGPIDKDRQIISDKVVYHGEIRDAEIIKEIMTSADVLVCPSYSEGMPNVILEAMASGLAIIATDVGAVSELVNDENGMLINAGSAEELETAMLKFIQMPDEKMISMKKKSIEIVKNKFLWEDIIIRTIAEIKRVLKYKNM